MDKKYFFNQGIGKWINYLVAFPQFEVGKRWENSNKNGTKDIWRVFRRNRLGKVQSQSIFPMWSGNINIGMGD